MIKKKREGDSRNREGERATPVRVLLSAPPFLGEAGAASSDPAPRAEKPAPVRPSLSDDGARSCE